MKRLTRKLAKNMLRRLTGSSPRNILEALMPLLSGGAAPHPVECYREQRVMVLAPHPDDEAIGCGGVLLHHAAAGAHIVIVYLTDGRLGDSRLPQLNALAREASQRELTLQRQQEARDYAHALPATESVFLNAEDGHLAPHPEITNTLANLISTQAPNLLYLPFAWDTHEDHWQANLLTVAALESIPDTLRSTLVLRGYEVWAPLPANRVADISSVFDEKIKLIGHYVSQLRDSNYIHCISGLNAYRSLALPQRQGYAEAFYECSAARYVDLIKRMGIA